MRQIAGPIKAFDLTRAGGGLDPELLFPEGPDLYVLDRQERARMGLLPRFRLSRHRCFMMAATPARETGAVEHENPIQQLEPFVTRVQLAEHLGVSMKTIERWEKRGLPHHRWGPRIIRYRVSEAKLWLEHQRLR